MRLDSDRKPNKVVMDADFFSMSLRYPTVSQKRRYLSKGLHAAQTCAKGEQLERGEKFLRLLNSSLDIEGHHSTRSFALSFLQGVLRMALQARIVNAVDFRVLLKHLSNSHCVTHSRLDSHSQCLTASHSKPRVE